MTTLIVSPLSHVEKVIQARRPSHIISLLDPDSMIETPAGYGAGQHHKVAVHDIAQEAEGLTLIDEATVEQALRFGLNWPGRAPLLIHCWAGISRSTATAFAIACARNPYIPERTIATRLRRTSRYAFPNKRIVALADELLDRRGRMRMAIDTMARGELAAEGRPFDLPIFY